MLRHIFVVVTLLLFTFQSTFYGQPANGFGKPSAAHLKAYLNQAAEFGFSGSVLVAMDGNILVHNGYGFADRARGLKVKADDVFDIGSITKQFTAAAIMKLETQGKLKTEDLISKYLDNVPADKAEVTLHHALTHTAGFINYSGGDYEVAERDATIRRILQAPLTHKPGTRMAYSNSGYSVLAAIVEKVSGQPYERFLYEQLFKPAGMNRTGYMLPKFSKTELPHGYEAGEDKGTPLDHQWSPTGPYWNLFGNGGILSTTGDMYKWYLALQGEKILSAEAKKKMFTPFLNDYAYGWDVSQTPMGLQITHNGASAFGFNAVMGWFPEKKLVGIAMSNTGRFLETQIYSEVVMTKLGRLLAGETFKPLLKEHRFVNLDAAALKKYVGAYRIAAGDEFRVSYRNDQLLIESVGQEPAELLMQDSNAGLRDATDRARSIAEGIVKKDFQALKANLATEESFDRLKTSLEQRFSNWEKSDGIYKSFQLLGTVPAWWSDDGSTATLVRIEFEKRPHLFRLHWKNGKITGIGGEGISAPISFPLRAISESSFVGWHAMTTKSIDVQFADNGKNLSVTSGGKTVMAERVAE